MSNPNCIMPECDRKPYCRKMCRPHYEADMGYTNVRVRAKVTYACEDCGATHQCDRRDAKKQTRCPACARKNAQRVRALTREPRAESCRVHTGKVCAHCGSVFTARHGKRKYCGDYCSREAALTKQGCRDRTCAGCDKPLGRVSYGLICASCKQDRLKVRRRIDRANRPKGLENHRRRARHYGVDYEPINHLTVFERDGWICGICGERIPQAAKHPDPLSASLDHILPLSRGGGHVYTNVQASHFICNSRKSDRVPGGVQIMNALHSPRLSPE